MLYRLPASKGTFSRIRRALGSLSMKSVPGSFYFLLFFLLAAHMLRRVISERETREKLKKEKAEVR